MTDTYTHNAYGELAAYSASHGSSEVYTVVYADAEDSRDPLGRVIRKDETLLGTTITSAYTYDARGRLTDVAEDGTAVEHFEYDLNGNRMRTTTEGTVQATYDEQDRLLAHGDDIYTYSANGARETRTHTPTGDQTTYSYDALGNLLSAELPDSTLIEYVVDGHNRRIARRIDGATDKRWLYRDGLNPVAQLDADGWLEWRYVYASKPNVPDYAIRISDGAIYRIISDQLGSVALVVNITDPTDILLVARYSAFGEQTVLQGSADAVPFGFAGGLYDAATGLVRFGARDYDPTTGRWTSKEPLGFAGSMNFYVYAFGDPINLQDFNGLEVNLCSQPWLGVPHQFIRTDSYQFGLSWHPDPFYGSWFWNNALFAPTYVLDHDIFYNPEGKLSRQEQDELHGLTCEPQPNANEECLNDLFERTKNHYLGTFPAYNCHAYARWALSQCSQNMSLAPDVGDFHRNAPWW